MGCDECMPILEEYMDGEIGERDANLVATHLAGCSACGSAFQLLKREQEVYASYDRDIEVTPKLWAAVHARIKTERIEAAREPFAQHSRLRSWLGSVFSVPRVSPAVAAVLVILAIGATALVMKFASSPDSSGDGKVAKVHEGNTSADTSTQPGLPGTGGPSHPETKAEAGKRGSGATPVSLPASNRKTERSGFSSTSEDLVWEAEQKYRAAIAVLSRDIDRRRSEFDPEVIAKYEVAIAAIDRTIADTRWAARQHPQDPVALQYMLTAYAKKVDLLRDMASF